MAAGIELVIPIPEETDVGKKVARLQSSRPSNEEARDFVHHRCWMGRLRNNDSWAAIVIDLHMSRVQHIGNALCVKLSTNL
jgi:hypothetical protein